jgi:hypothetical protein
MPPLLLSDDQVVELLKNGARHNAGEDIDPFPVVKLFTPDANATWLFTEMDPTDTDSLFGLCNLGLGFPELGDASLSEIGDVCGAMGLPVERDLHFKADKPLGAYADLARVHSRIIT